MNCHESRIVLDAVYPGVRMEEDPLVQGAAAHARTCPDCSIWLSLSHVFDRWLAPAIRDAAVPDRLRNRLLQSLTSSPAPSLVQPARRTRRMWLAGTAAAVAIAAVVGILNVNPEPERDAALTMNDALQRLDKERAAFSGLKSFDRAFTPQVPPDWKSWVGAPLGIDLVAGPEHDAAVYRFKAGDYEGYLVVIAPGRVSDTPDVFIPHESRYDYDNERVSWTSDGQVLVCYLDADSPRMEDFLRDLSRQSA